MFCKQKRIIYFSLIFLASCTGSNIFQPPPPVYEQWKKINASEFDVKKSMLECGYPSPVGEYGSGNIKSDINGGDAVLMHKCMRGVGYKYDAGSDNNFDVCYRGNSDIPECRLSVPAPHPSVQKRLNSLYCKKYPQDKLCI